MTVDEMLRYLNELKTMVESHW